MAGRIRTIKPEILEDEVAAGLSDAAWRMWVSTWTLADDHGNLRAGERYLAANVWQDTSRDAATPLKELIQKGRFRAYAVNRQHYVHIVGFTKHQRVDNAGKPRVPGPHEDDGTWLSIVTESFAEENAMPTVAAETNNSRGSRDTRARIPAAGPPTSDLRPPITDPEPRADARRTGDANETKIPEPPEGITPIRSMTIGRPAAEAYEASARAALGSYALPTGKFAVEDVVAAVNGHAPPGLPWRELDALIRVSVAAYIADTRENPKREAGFHPRKWLDWLNGDPSRSATLKRKPSPQRAPAPRSPPRPPDTGVSLAEAARLASAAADALDQSSRDSSDSAPQGSAA